MANEQLRKLTKKIPAQFIGQNHNKKDAADHTVITQLLLRYVGPYSFEHVQTFYSVPKRGQEPILNGVVCRLTCEIDGRTVSVEEAGGMENAGNADGDGERMKHCMSDALKRCAMRMGLGLHIWAQEAYFLDRKLAEDAKEGAGQNSARADNGRIEEPPVQENGASDKQQDDPPPDRITKADAEKIKALAEEVYDGGVEELVQKRGRKVGSLSAEEAQGWLKGLDQKRTEKMRAARHRIEEQKGAANKGKS